MNGRKHKHHGHMNSKSTGGNVKGRKKARYTSDLPRRMYSFFISYSDTGAPSVEKFARSIGVTLSDIEGYREHGEFERAYNECSEIRRDYLIDNGLTKRFDSSFTKFVLVSEYGMGEAKPLGNDGSVQVTIDVIDDSSVS